MGIYKPSELGRLGIRPKKHLSQNFLIDRNILNKICDAADVQEEDHILEIGPGPGALTECFLSRGAQVTAVEKDKELAEKLKRLDCDALNIICGDALTFPLDVLPEKVKVIANLPFHIATPIIERFIDKYPQIVSLTFVVQQEVGRRMTAEVNTAMYSSFTLFLSAYSTPHYCFTIKPTSFSPAPAVHSCVVHLPLKDFPFSFPEKEFFILTRTAFGKRRKMLRASLKELYGSEEVEKALIAIGFKPTVRPQELSLTDFGALFEKLVSEKDDQPNE